jgi:glutamine cyclotransferase
LNELEYINGFIYANQYQYPYIVKIDPSNGLVVGKLDFTEVVQRTKAKYPQADFLNGIAFNPQTNKVYITGKLWPEIYEVNFPF